MLARVSSAFHQELEFEDKFSVFQMMSVSLYYIRYRIIMCLNVDYNDVETEGLRMYYMVVINAKYFMNTHEEKPCMYKTISSRLHALQS